MTSAPVSHSTPAALPGLDHLRGHVQNWDAAVRTLALTATALAESLGAAAPQKRGWPAAAAAAAAEQEAAACGAPPTSTPRSLLPLWPPAPPSLLLPAGHLKPGRVFVVANLQGAYYTLLELLARHKFDFRTDNLLHLGNLVAPPPPPPPPPAATANASRAGGGDYYMQQSQRQQQQQVEQEEQKVVSGSAQPRRFRNSSSVLKLVRRHGGLGPMGANECLALLAAARANRQRAEQQQQQQAAAAAEEEEEGRLRLAGAVRKAPGGRCSALSLQLAAVAAAAGPAAAVAFQRCSDARPSCTPTPTPTATTSAPASSYWLGLSGRSSDSSPDSSDGDGEDGPREEGDVEMVAAPLTPHNPPGADHAAPHPTRFAPPPAAATCSTGGGGGAAAPSFGIGPSLDDAGLVQLLSMPACVVLQAYGVELQHVSPREEDGSGAAVAAGACGERGFHLLFSHRRPGGGLPAGAGGGGAATATGLASGRGDVVRFAVLPPVRTLQRWSPGFGAAMAAAAAPSREDLMLEVMEEPLSELDS
ncbi:hypothetical protein PLESTM_000396400 [Pleodorina starrii]|nr:hypothetical protein PLESTM_000396400 [Pleodorina starrii]